MGIINTNVIKILKNLQDSKSILHGNVITIRVRFNCSLTTNREITSIIICYNIMTNK